MCKAGGLSFVSENIITIEQNFEMPTHFSGNLDNGHPSIGQSSDGALESSGERNILNLK